jgi:hypothetical protein
VSDLRANVIALLRKELGDEAAAGFPRLKRIPYTHIIWFLDYFAALPPGEQGPLLDALARFGARSVLREGGPRELQELEAQYPAFARFRAERNEMGGRPGFRYTDVKMQSMIARDTQSGGLALLVNRLEPTALARHPRPDLLPDMSHLKPPKPAALRKLAEAALAGLFPAQKTNLGAGSWKYAGPFEGSELTVWLDLGSRLGQLVYGVSVANPAHAVRFVRVSHEALWGAHLGWDYLTEENAERCVRFLPELVAYLARLAGRLNAAAGSA